MITVYPVIHYFDDLTTMSEANLAFSLNADGVFLISHLGDDSVLSPLVTKLKKLHPTKHIGVNYLTKNAVDAFKEAETCSADMLWVDNPNISSKGSSEKGDQFASMTSSNNKLKVFASVAFKYQTPEPFPEKAALEVANREMVATTSGPGTGSAPSVFKIKSMKQALGGFPLAVASGMSPENIHSFKPFLDYVLVSTGVSKDSYHFDMDRLATFIKLCKS